MIVHPSISVYFQIKMRNEEEKTPFVRWVNIPISADHPNVKEIILFILSYRKETG